MQLSNDLSYIFSLNFSRLVRQDNVKEEFRANEQRSPSKRTFADAKQTLSDYDDMNQMNPYNDSMYNSENTFLEADEDESFDIDSNVQQYQSSYYGASDTKLPFEEPDLSMNQVVGGPNVHSVESYLNDSLPEYSPPTDDSTWYGRPDRPYRRRSRDFNESEIMGGPSYDEEHRRKPETMRSISEDTPTRTAKQAVTRRTLSHPEKESQSQVG